MLDRAPEFLFENVGSHGDVMPFLNVAAELARCGRCCQLLANEHFRPLAEAHGVGFHAHTTARTHGELPGDSASYLYFKFDGARAYFARPNAFDPQTIVVSMHNYGALEPLAESHRLRTVRLHLFPSKIKSLIAPSWPLGARACGPGGDRFLSLTLPAMYRAASVHPRALARINTVRAQVGLPAVDTADYERRHVVAQAALFPEWYGMPAADWPQLQFLGFPLPRSSEPLPAQVGEFLARHPRPLVFTTGTGYATPEPFFEAAARCCSELGMPGIFLSPFSSAPRSAPGAALAHFDYVELETLLPHAALIVHHGGLGTTARALQAGIPQLISPIGFDQPDNGHRVELLGAGRVVPRESLSGAVFARAVRELLADRATATRLPYYAAALTRPRAIEDAADFLLGVARSTPVSGASVTGRSAVHTD